MISTIEANLTGEISAGPIIKKIYQLYLNNTNNGL
jgi:hypothetical protein